MATEVRVPTTGHAGEAVVIVDWLVSVGTTVAIGDVLLTLETAKSEVEVTSPAAGELLEIRHVAGDEVSEHSVIATIGTPGELATEPPTQPARPPTPTPQGIQAAQTVQPLDPVKASPRATLVAKRNNIDLSTIVGSGPNSRIIVSDVIAARARTSAPLAINEPEEIPSSPTNVSAPPYTTVPVRGARKVTAQRMHASLQETAQVTLTRYANADALLSYSSRLKEVTESTGRPRIGMNDLLMFATARAIADHPEANATFEWSEIRQFSSVSLGFAVDTGTALLVPVIAAAEALSISEIATASRTAIEKARAGKLTGDDMAGGTFTISNMGSLGVHWFTPVLNPPQVCILGVGATHQLHPQGSALLPLSLTFDHRALDGAAAAQVLASIASAIESIDVLTAL